MDFNQELENVKKELRIEAEENQETSKYEKELIKTLNVNGEPVVFDFGMLTGNHILEVKEQYRKIRKSRAAMLEEFDDLYYILIAQKVTGIPYTKFLSLKFKEYNAIKVAARDFLSED